MMLTRRMPITIETLRLQASFTSAIGMNAFSYQPMNRRPKGRLFIGRFFLGHPTTRNEDSSPNLFMKRHIVGSVNPR